MEEQERKLKKVKKSCSTAKKITKVIAIAVAVAGIASIIGAVLCMAFHTDLNAAIKAHSITISMKDDAQAFGIFHMQMDTEWMEKNEMYAEMIAMGCGFSAVVCAIMSFIFALICKIFKILEMSDTPFTPYVLKRMKTAFILTTVLLVLMGSTGAAIIAGLSFWCVYCILDYGIALQTEIDETL